MSETRSAAADERELLAACLSNSSLHLVILPTEACNFSCTYCYETFRAGRMDANVVRGVKALLARRAPGLRELSISWFGGEPLLARDLIEDVMEHVRRLAEANPELHVASDATTNGYLLTPAAAARLIDLGVTRYQVTFDPPRERHDRIRARRAGGATYRRIWDNLVALRRRPLEFRMLLRVHVDRENEREIAGFLDHCARAFGTDSRYEFFIRGLSWPDDPALSGRTLLGTVDGDRVVEGLRALARERGLRVTEAKVSNYVCYAAKANSFVVRADGRLNKCTVALEAPGNQVGRIHEDGTVAVDSTNLGWWMRGVWSGSQPERLCPMRSATHGPPGVGPGRGGIAAPLLVALLLAWGGGRGVPAGAAPLGVPRDSASATTPAPAQPTLDEIRVWNSTGKNLEAEHAARAMLRDAEGRHGAESMEVGEILDELAVAMRRLGRGGETEVLEMCERAIRIKERLLPPGDPGIASSRHNLGMTYRARKNPRRALAELETALRIREAAFGANDPRIAKTLFAVGAIHFDLGEFEAGLPYAERGVAIEEIALEPNDPERAAGLDALAGLRYKIGDVAGAIPLFAEALRLWERSPIRNLWAIGTSCNNLGGMYLEIGDVENALSYLRRAVEIREREPGDRRVLLAGSIANLADAYHQAGDRPKAKEEYRRAVRMLESVDVNTPDLCAPLANLGWLQIEERDFEGAERSLGRSLSIQEANPEADPSVLDLTLRGLAGVARGRGERDRARSDYERAIAHLRATVGPAHPDLGRALVEFASFHLESGDSLTAFETALHAAEINREHMKVTMAGITERQALALASQIETGLDVAFAALAGRLRVGGDDLARRAWDAEVRSRALVLDEIGGRARWVTGAGKLVDAARALESARSRLARIIVRGSRPAAGAAEEEATHRARADVEAAERNLAAENGKFRTEVDRIGSGIDRVLASLPVGTALVSYTVYGKARRRAYMAFVAGADRAAIAVPLGPASEIERSVAAWRALAGRPPSGGRGEVIRAELRCREAGEAVRARIWDPVAPFLEGSRLVLVVPDGSIGLVSLAGLPSRSGGYLVEEPRSVHYLSAERDVIRGARVHTHGAGLLAVGDPAYDAHEDAPRSRAPDDVVAVAPPSGGALASYRDALAERGDFSAVRFTPLHETSREIEELAAVWGAARGALVLTGVRAGERAVKDLLPGRRVAHIATHGFYLGDPERVPARGTESPGSAARGIGGLAPGPGVPQPRPASTNPLHLSGLALAGANLRDRAAVDVEDGILIAEEIASLDLSDLDWVVLSACQTGLGEVRFGEGVLGFRRAFEMAGAGTLILSLWSVEDRSTRSWMKRLYRGRLDGALDTAGAVREAHLRALAELRDGGHPTHPFYWAAFIAVGDWR